jgi:hypothetical protein
MVNLNYIKICTLASKRTFFNCEEFLVFLHIPGSYNSKIVLKGLGVYKKYNYKLKNKSYFEYMYNLRSEGFI